MRCLTSVRLSGYWIVFFILFMNTYVCFTDKEDEDIPVVEGDGGNVQIEKDGDVLVLTADNFDIVTASRDVILVEFYAPWCGHCKQFEPEYAKAATQLKEHTPPIEIAKVDGSKESELAQRYDVSGFPTILLFKKGNMVEPYDGSRTSLAIVEYMKQRADPNYKPPPKKVMELTSENFNETVTSSKLILVEFYTQNCSACNRLDSAYERAALSLSEHYPSIPLAKIDGEVNKEIAEMYKVSQWPTFKMFRYGRVYDYSGPTEDEGIVQHMTNQLMPPSVECNTYQQLINSMKKQAITVVGYFSSSDEHLYQEFIAAAYDLRGLFSFSHTLNDDVRKKFNEDANTILIYKPAAFQSEYEASKYLFNEADGSVDELKSFIHRNKVPLVGERTRLNMDDYLEFQRPLCVVYFDVNFNHDFRAASQIVRKQVLRVANDLRNITFALSNEEEFQDELVGLGLDDSGEDINVGLFIGTKRRYALQPEDEFNSDILKSFVEDVTQGKLKPKIKSQPVPKKNSGPVVKVVGETLHDLLQTTTKDLLIEFYAPWCGHCKALEPKYEELAEKYAGDERIIVAKMDATVNDFDEMFAIDGYPTIYLLKANKKNSPIHFTGEMTVDGLSKFIEENVGAKVTHSDEL